MQIGRWNGPLGNFTQVDGRTGPGLNNGDQIKATIVGNIITAYINNVAIFSVTDSTYANGAPGMGFYLQGGTSALNSDFGLSSYSATDGGLGPAVPSAPTPADAATGVNRLPTLTWTSAGATNYDVSFGTTASPSVVSTGQASASYSPSALAAATTYFWQAIAHSTGGTTNGPVWSFTTTPKTTPTITWTTPAAIVYGTALGATQLNATTAASPGRSSTRRGGTVLSARAPQTLSVTFTPTERRTTPATETVDDHGDAKATPTITWATPAAIVYGTALSATQLNATTRGRRARSSTRRSRHGAERRRRRRRCR